MLHLDYMASKTSRLPLDSFKTARILFYILSDRWRQKVGPRRLTRHCFRPEPIEEGRSCNLEPRSLAAPMFQLAQPLPGSPWAIFSSVGGIGDLQIDSVVLNGTNTAYATATDNNPTLWGADPFTVASWMGEAMNQVFSPSTTSMLPSIGITANLTNYYETSVASTGTFGLNAITSWAQSGNSLGLPPQEISWNIVDNTTGPPQTPWTGPAVKLEATIVVTYIPATSAGGWDQLGFTPDPLAPFSPTATGTNVGFTSSASGIIVSGPTMGNNLEPTALAISTINPDPEPGQPDWDTVLYDDFFSSQGMNGAGESVVRFTHTVYTGDTIESIRYATSLTTGQSTAGPAPISGLSQLTFHFDEDVS